MHCNFVTFIIIMSLSDICIVFSFSTRLPESLMCDRLTVQGRGIKTFCYGFRKFVESVMNAWYNGAHWNACVVGFRKTIKFGYFRLIFS